MLLSAVGLVEVEAVHHVVAGVDAQQLLHQVERALDLRRVEVLDAAVVLLQGAHEQLLLLADDPLLELSLLLLVHLRTRDVVLVVEPLFTS